MQYFKNRIKKKWAYLIYRQKVKPQAYEKLKAQSVVENHIRASDAIANLFTYHGEDGIIQKIIHLLPKVSPIFVDVGSGNCITSNCATLAVHNKWKGLFIDNNDLLLSIGVGFYKRLKLSENLQFAKAFVTPESVNGLLNQQGFYGPVGLLSIDIDGNDFWVWKAINIIQPSIVVIEAKVEFGLKNLVVPEGTTNHHQYNKKYNGASVVALKTLGASKGYTLIAANPLGYNLFFIRKDLVTYLLPEIRVEETLQHPETIKSFYPESFFKNHTFVSP